MIILYEKPYLRIAYVRQHRLLEVQWLHSSISAGEFRDAYWQALLLAERYQARAWLSDFRAMPLPQEAEVQWLEKYWYPRYVELKLDKVAIVNSGSEAGRRRLTEIIQRANAAGHTNRPDPMYFDDLETARAWVRKPLTTGQLPSLG
ncbi:hypothetical protein [Hymenobacter sp. CRA2]|uniref:hypothetical protein n=1 Tax=Hymenobacter sp. CRA2 TaxID=1955620 RepID=UPI00098F618B|nr:hypothetical protein [Hymenobacter sp. CRA2]OON71063.1 hypothetical protein B0919_03470 [Hymenobacter sp. CRA2]